MAENHPNRFTSTSANAKSGSAWLLEDMQFSQEDSIRLRSLGAHIVIRNSYMTMLVLPPFETHRFSLVILIEILSQTEWFQFYLNNHFVTNVRST